MLFYIEVILLHECQIDIMLFQFQLIFNRLYDFPWLLTRVSEFWANLDIQLPHLTNIFSMAGKYLAQTWGYLVQNWTRTVKKTIYGVPLLSKLGSQILWALITQRWINAAQSPIRHFEAEIMQMEKMSKNVKIG